jgi:hypothetical protein
MKRIVTLLLLCILAQTAIFAGTNYRLSEHLGMTWTDELISFPVDFPAKACKEIRVVTADDTPVVFQATDVERYPDKSVKSARVYVKTSLASGQTIIFRALDDNAVKGVTPAKAVTTIRITEKRGQVTLEHGLVGVKLPIGRFTKDIPAPYQGFKLTSGRWSGASAFMGTPGPISLDAHLLERGPLFAEVELAYRYPHEKAYTLRCRVIAGAPVALFSETSNVETGCNYAENMGPSDKRFFEYARNIRFRQGRFGYWDAFEKSHWIKLDFTAFQPDLPTSFRAYASLTGDPTAFYYDTIEKSLPDPWIATMFPYQSWHGGVAQWSLENNTDYLGLMATHPGRWVRALENLPVIWQKDGQVSLQLPINDGRREWGVHFGMPGDAMIHPGDMPTPQRRFMVVNDPPPLRRALITYGQISLDTVKDWTLAWEDTQPVKNPTSVFPQGDLAAIHARYAADPAAQKLLLQGNEADKYLATGTEAAARKLYDVTMAQIDQMVKDVHRGVGVAGYNSNNGYMGLTMANTASMGARNGDLLLGSPFITPEEKVKLRARLAWVVSAFSDPDMWPSDDFGKGDYLWSMYRGLDIGQMGCTLAGNPAAVAWRDYGCRTIEESLTLLNGTNGVLWYGTHYGGNTMDPLLPLMVQLKMTGGRDYFTDPRFQRGMLWYASLLPPVDSRFGRAYSPPYGYSHPPGAGHSARWAVVAAMTRDTDPEFSRLMMSLWERQGKPLGVFISGNALAGVIDPHLPAAPPTQESTVWEGWGAVLRAHAETKAETYLSVTCYGADTHAFTLPLAGGRDGLRCDPAPTTYDSQHSVGGAGLQQGPPRGWYYSGERNPGRGALHLYGKGAPLALTFGARAFNDNVYQSVLMNNRVGFDNREETTFTTDVRAWSALDAADYFGMDTRVTQLQGNAYVLPEDPGGLTLSAPRPVKGAPTNPGKYGNIGTRLGAIEDVPEQAWQRRILFVKDADPLGPNYYIMRDNVKGTLPTEWNLWAMGEQHIRDNGASYVGPNGVNLEVYRLGVVDNVVTGSYANRGKTETQQLLQYRNPANTGYTVVLYPCLAKETPPVVTPLAEGHGAKLQWPDRTDRVFLQDTPDPLLADGVELLGLSGAVQEGKGWTRLVLSDGARLAWGDCSLEQGLPEPQLGVRPPVARNAVAVTLTAKKSITGEAVGEARRVIITVPAAYHQLKSLTMDGKTSALSAGLMGRYTLVLPAGRHQFTLQ